eukprot:gene6762-biopygen2057
MAKGHEGWARGWLAVAGWDAVGKSNSCPASSTSRHASRQYPLSTSGSVTSAPLTPPVMVTRLLGATTPFEYVFTPAADTENPVMLYGSAAGTCWAPAAVAPAADAAAPRPAARTTARRAVRIA